ncbi:BTAD domain-containing putative transcriptional regulator [Streptomyces sp. GDS52]|uniref:BTAD domain-containing putative transcriptional regulator n=1 Tax=Streptomyces cathayae TaxID=3031124 RepID=A0ABY8JX23_9ACTN|nr:BTAD domain-containing putative transcriptional regulator [Streptomyces sp. HUAS 5]WGD39933.1 BTAD domain-containing putative transcriptional regulator [Streptomyces sp. HUAS 5]
MNGLEPSVFRVLGSVEAEAGGRAVTLGGAKQRTVLAAMLLAGGRPLSDDRLKALLWGCEPPATATAQLYTYVSRLRKCLGTDIHLERHAHAYRLDTRGAFFDWTVFESLVDRGRADLTAGRYTAAADRLGQALALRRGPVLSDVTVHLRERQRPLLDEALLSTREDRIEAELALGGHDAAVPQLMRLVMENPLRERLLGQLMTALHRCGRQAEALAVYERGRRMLRDELGVDPGRALRDIRQAVLTGTLARSVARGEAELSGTALALPDGGPRSAVARARARDRGAWNGVVPAMLPADVADFSGRRRELAALMADLRRAGPSPLVVTGAAGTGTSALAVHAAHRARQSFPDGQLHADLSGGSGRPRSPGEVLGWFLRAMGVAEHELPASTEERGQLYRSLLADRRMLVLLDNAVDDRQVRPLLPGTDGCRTLITGRDSFTTLPGVRPVPLGPMSAREGHRMLSAIVGPERTGDEPDAAARIVELCDRLPLALRIVAARLAAHPRRRLAAAAARLEPEERRLDELREGDLDIRAALSSGHRRVTGPVRTALGVLASGCPDVFDSQEAANALSCLEEDAEDALETLAAARLLEVSGPAPHRYRLTPLVRLFAREQSRGGPASPGTPDGGRRPVIC